MAIVTREDQRLYLPSWQYNAALIMSELAKIVENHGGKVKPQKAAIISNRSLDGALREDMERLTRYEKIIEEGHGNEKTVEALTALKISIAKRQAINNEPVRVTHTTYITFTLDGYVYYYQLEENPFFDFLFSKTPLRGNVYSRDAVLTEANKEWLYDCFLMAGCPAADIVEAANLIFNELTNAKDSVIRRDSKRQKVANTFDGGWHWETVYSPERTAVIDW